MLSALKSQIFTGHSGSLPEGLLRDDEEAAHILEKRPRFNSRPSNVSWIPPSRSEPSLNLYAPSIGRSASSPSLLNNNLPKRPRLKRTDSFKSTQSLRPAILSRGHDIGSAISTNEGRPLSPVVEKPSDARRLTRLEGLGIHAGALHALPSDEVVPSPSSTYSAFIRRPIKRTVSQSSSLHTSGASQAAPSLPPLALGPNLSPLPTTPSATQAPTAPSPLKSQWQGPSSATTRHRMSDVSEEADAQSFVTAVSVHDSRYTTRAPSVLAGTAGNPFDDPDGAPSILDGPEQLDWDARSLYARSTATRSVLPADARSLAFGFDDDEADNDTDDDHDDHDDNTHHNTHANSNVQPVRPQISVEPVPVPRPEIAQPAKAATRISFAPQVELAPSGSTPMPLSAFTSGPSQRSTTAPGSNGTPPTSYPSAEALYDAAAAEAQISPATSSFVDRRWHFGRWSTASAQKVARGSLAEKLPKNERKVDPVKLLFWLGFIAGPWLWVVGGWGIRSRLPVETGSVGNVLPSWIAAQAQQNGGPPVSQADVASFVKPKLDPWVRRCRLAAAIGCCLLVVALLLACVVLVTMR